MNLDEIEAGAWYLVKPNPAMGHLGPLPVRVVEIDSAEMYPVVGESVGGRRYAVEASELAPLPEQAP